MTESKLAAIAARMRAAVAAQPYGWTRYTLARGLDLVLSHRAEAWRLALRREEVYPSDQEAAILFRAFGVPEGTEPEKRKQSETHPSTQRRIEWRIVEFNWRETDSDGAMPA